MARSDLMDAALQGDAERLRARLDRGGDPNAADERGWTALVYAVMGRHVEIVEDLLRAGADVNRRTTDGATPLMKATLWGDAGCVAALLRGGADRTPVDADGWTAESLAEAAGHVEITRLLGARHGAAVNTGEVS